MSEETAKIHVQSRGGVGWITLDHPPLNVITTAMAKAICEAIETFDADSQSKIIVFTASGERAFAAGADVGEHTLENVRALNDQLFALVRCLMRPVGKPRIAAVKGICSGGANELAFACDFVVAREDTRFATPEIKIGAVGSLGALMMARFMSPGKALELALNGDWMSAADARSFGLVTQVLPLDGYETELRKYLARFTSKSMAAMWIGRKQFRQLVQPISDSVLTELSRSLMQETIALEDSQEGVAAFLEKRKPVWKDR